MESKIRIFLMLIAAATIAACDSGPGPGAVIDPGAYQYKGATDPLTAVAGGDRAGGLSDRFDLVQGRQ